jgi:hypothetical protein
MRFWTTYWSYNDFFNRLRYSRKSVRRIGHNSFRIQRHVLRCTINDRRTGAMNLNLSVIAQIASILGFLGVVVAAASLIVALRRYRQTKRSEYISTIRKAIFTSRSSLEKIAETVWFNYDFVYEMTSGVADSKPLKVASDEMYHRFFQLSPRPSESTPDADASEKEQKRQEELNKYLDPQESAFPMILVPIHGSLLQMCDNLITKTGGELEPYRFDYPGLTRVFLSVNQFFSNFITNYKNYVRDDTVWRRAVTDVDAMYGNTIDTPDELNGRLTEHIVGQWYQENITNNKDDQIVQKLVEIVKIVSSAYLSASEQKLLDAAKRETAEEFTPMERATKLTDNLNEAYKGLKWVLEDLDEQTYHDLVREVAEQTR